MMLRLHIHRDNMAGISEASISENILDLKRGIFMSLRKKKETPFRFILFSDEEVETYFVSYGSHFCS